MSDYYYERVEDSKSKFQIPELYTKEDASPEDKQIYEYYKKIMDNLEESAATQRGKVFTIVNGLEYTIWEEPEAEYLERMSKL